eukprot:gnl/MRDRNA2_/MRDRNA2_121255_c0_seq1.p1 gnl/MRDRNA2_/MRDRNA2_121255_c0~~gnl/MRDRNA2_/MRDRNA2_121255_c0_seq1.p1  ORF type:complete len:128 (+),score=34.65 gnl/MRDRNA2_/MRDRNA2_121255_c0_seq1:101-484(+)
MAFSVREIFLLLTLLVVNASNGPKNPAPMQKVNGDLHNEMRAMMDDDDDDDLESENAKGGFLQTGTGSDETSQYLADSASGLSAALGERWNGEQLEKNAKQSTQALLQGIANPKAVQNLNRMLHALR